MPRNRSGLFPLSGKFPDLGNVSFFPGFFQFFFQEKRNLQERTFFGNNFVKSDDSGNAMFQSYLSQTIQKRNRLKIRSYRRYGEHGEKILVFLGLFVHAAVRGGTCAFTLKIVNMLIKNSSRDDRPSIST